MVWKRRVNNKCIDALCIKSNNLLDQSNLDNWDSKYPQIQDYSRQECATTQKIYYAHLYVLCSTYVCNKNQTSLPATSQQHNKKFAFLHDEKCNHRGNRLWESETSIFLNGLIKVEKQSSPKTYFDNQYTVSVSTGRKMMYFFRKKDHGLKKGPSPFSGSKV